MDLARALVLSFMKNRPIAGLQSSILKKRAMFLGLPMPGESPAQASSSMTTHPKLADKKSFCVVCYAQLPHLGRTLAKVVKEQSYQRPMIFFISREMTVVIPLFFYIVHKDIS